MSGDLLAVPVLNVPAFWSGTRTSPLDDANLARVFPGNPDGTPSQQIAWHFAHSVIARADFYLDLHSAGIHYRMPGMAGYPSGRPPRPRGRRGLWRAGDLGAPTIDRGTHRLFRRRSWNPMAVHGGTRRRPDSSLGTCA